MDKDKIIEHLMGENEFYRYILMQYENKINTLNKEIEYLKEKSRSKRIKKEALKRDNYECVRCGSDENLHVHHIISLSDGGNDVLSNVETLCIDCHIKVHEGQSSRHLLVGLRNSL